MPRRWTAIHRDALIFLCNKWFPVFYKWSPGTRELQKFHDVLIKKISAQKGLFRSENRSKSQRIN